MDSASSVLLAIGPHVIQLLFSGEEVPSRASGNRKRRVVIVDVFLPGWGSIARLS